MKVNIGGTVDKTTKAIKFTYGEQQEAWTFISTDSKSKKHYSRLLPDYFPN